MADYQAFLENFEQQRQQGQSSGLAATSVLTEGVNPDAAAKARSTARFLGVAPAAVEAMPAEYERDARVRKIDLDTQATPTLRQRYTDADFMKLASDDSGVLSGVESVVRRMLAPRRDRKPVTIDPVMGSVQFSDTVRRMVERNPSLDMDTARALVLQNTQVDNGPLIGPRRGPAPTAGNIASGLFNLDRLRAASAGLGAMAADVLGLSPARELRNFSVARSRSDARTPEFETDTAGAIYGGLESTVDQAPGILLSVLMGNPAPSLALLGTQSYGSAYGKYRERGGTAGEAAGGAALETGVEVATELLPMSFLVKRLGKAGAGEFMTGMLAREIPGEQLATVVQDAVDMAIANPDKTWAQYLAERPDAAYQTLVATLTQTGVMASANVAARRLAGPQQDADRADEVARGAEELVQLMAASKLRERDPGSFADLVRQITDAGQTPSEMFIDAQQLANTLNQSGVDIEQLRELAPQVVEQLQDAVPGADVRAPVAELAALGPELTTPLVDHLREAPDAMSRAEAKQYLSEHEAKIKQEVERTLAQREEATAFKQQVQQATAQFEAELNAAARFRPEVNKAYATLLGNFYAVQALRAGVPLEQMLGAYQLQVRSQAPGGGQQLEQKAPAFKKWLGKSKVRDVVYHGTSADFSEFDTARSGLGAHFGTTEAANKRTGDLAGFSEHIGREDPPYSVMPVHIRLENPLRLPDMADLQNGESDDGEAFPRQWEDAEDVAETLLEKRVIDIDQFEEVRGDFDAIKRVLRELGYDGIVYKNNVEDEGRDSYIVFDAEQIKSAIGNDGTFDADDPSILSQDERGSLSFDADITASPAVIALLEGADLSTFIHESGHFFLEVQADLAARIQARISAGEEVSDGERAIVADMGKILTWFGVNADPNMSALDRWVAMSLEEKREHHEAWARGFERYVMEGKAPSMELQALFARFRAWLVSVYKTLAGLNVTLSDDVRQVMGRMIASDQAIGEAQAARDMGPMFQTPEQAGMTPQEYADYQALAERATAAASAELDARLMRDMKWLARARDKALKAAQAEANALRGEVEREVRAEVMAEPIYRAWTFLTGKQEQLAPGTVAPENIDATLQSGRLRSSFVKEIDAAAYERLAKLRMTSEERGLDPDIVAELFGFGSGQQLVQTLTITPPPQAVIDEFTDFRTLQRHGDITSPEALNRAADEAVHNELRARVIANELKALAKANKVTESGDDLYKNRDTVNVMTRAAEQYAAQVIARQQIKNLRPKQYAAAEARSARLAAQSLGKSTQEAAMHKRNQLVNNYATKAAYDAQAEVRKGVEFFRKVMRGSRDDISKTRDWDMVQAARAVLAEYGLGPKGEAAQKYLEAVEQYDPQTVRVLRDKVDTLTVNARPLNELTVEEFRGLLDEVKGLWYLAKRSRQVEIDGQLIDIEAAKIPLVERMEAIGIPDRVPGEGKAVTDGERRLARLRSAAAALRRVESWAGAKDGSTPGPFRKFIWQPVKEAADAYRADRAQFLRRYRDLLAGLDVGRARIHAPEIDYTFGYSKGGSGKAEILHALLHTGNASNKRKMLLGRGWASENADGTLNTTRWDTFLQRMIDTGVLTKKDFDFAQGVWDLLEDMKPQAQKAHRDVFGRYFDEVTADPFTNQFGTWRGGYVPAMADAEVVKDAATRKLQEDENQTLAYAFPATNRGFTKSRVEYNAPLLLDLRVLSSHIDKVLLFSHMEQPIREVRRILTSKAVAMPLHRIDPAAFDGILTPWMNRAARQQVETPIPGDNGLMRFFSKLRSRTGMAAMFANVVNTAQQITGVSIAAVKVRPKHLLGAMTDYVKAPRQFTRAVADASVYMASRMDNEVAQMSTAIDEILLNPSLYERGQQWAAKHAYFMQAAVDNVIGPVVWTGAYNQALEAGASERDAIRAGDAAVRETQGSTLPEDVSRIETGNAFVRLFTQFAGYFNMQANLLGTEFANVMHEQGLRKGMGRGLYVFTFGFLAPAMVSELIVQAFRGGPDDEDRDGVLDDWLMAVLGTGPLRSGLAMVPVIGPVANAAVNTTNSKPYDDRISTSPAVSMIEAAVRAPVEVYKAVTDDGNQRRAVRDLATLITLTTGLPATAMARPLGYAADVEQGKVTPTGPADAVRGAITGTASPDSKR